MQYYLLFYYVKHTNDKYEVYKIANNSKKLWEFTKTKLGNIKKTTKINHILENNIKITNSNDIDNCLNKFFNEIGNNLAKKIVKTQENQKFNNYRNTASIYLEPTTSLEIVSIIMNLKDSTNGVDKINTRVLKRICHFIAVPLSKIFNTCIETGNFPDHLKIAEIVPIFKNGKKTMFLITDPLL